MPVKFQLRDVEGGLISTAVAKIFLTHVSDAVAGSEIEGVSTARATEGNLFRYDPDEGQYVFNLSTRKLTQGTWRITIRLDDGADYTVDIGLLR